MQNTRLPIFITIICLLLLMAILDLFVGSVFVTVSDMFDILKHRFLNSNKYADSPMAFIILDYRFPKMLTALFSGAALGVAGILMQTHFNNPLAGPYVLGISSGASLGVAFLLLGASFIPQAVSSVVLKFGITTFSLLGSFGVMMVILIVASRFKNNVGILLIGLMLSYFSGAIISLLSFISTAEMLQNYTFWGFGSFAQPTWNDLTVYVPLLSVGLVGSIFLSKHLDLWLLGENYMISSGVHVKRLRFWILGLASIFAGLVTAYCGPIGFVGLAVPHVARRLIPTSKHIVLIPACALVGGLLTLSADIICHLPSGQTLPVNAVTAIIGAPIVVSVILKQRALKI